MTDFIPQDPNFADRIGSSLDLMPTLATLGAELIEASAGRMVLGLKYDKGLTQQHGFLHAGITTTLMDTACGFAAASLMPANTGVLTIEFKVNLLAPGQGERFRFVGETLKPGRTISVCEGRAYGIKEDGAEKLIATMTATMMTVIDRAEVQG